MIKCFLDPNKEIPCNVYIGQEAGKELLEDMKNAKNSIKIISPYLSPNFVKLLIEKNKQNVDVQLITSDGIEDYKNVGSRDKNIYKLIKQDKTIIKEAQEKMEKLEDIAKILCYIIIAFIIIILGLFYFLQDSKILLGVVLVGLIYFIRNLYISKMKNLKIFNYSYYQTFPFKVFASSSSTNDISDYLIHSKLYIIDNKICYLGSVNLTETGIKHNIETSIKTADIEALNKISSFFDYVLNNLNKKHFDINVWGKNLYYENINNFNTKKKFCVL